MENIEPAFMETVALTELADDVQTNSLVLLLIFVPTIAIAYVVPMLATFLSKNNTKKWIFYWLGLLAASYLLIPILNAKFNAYSAAFLFLIFGGWLLIISNNERVCVWLYRVVFW